MTDRIHVLATFESREDLLAAMHRAVSWLILDEAHAFTALATEESLKLVLCTGDIPWYSEREIELAMEVWRAYPEAIAEAQKKPPAEAGGGGDKSMDAGV